MWGLFFTRIIFTFLSGTVKKDYVFVQWTGTTWAPVIYIVVIVLSLGIVVFDAAPRWGTSLQRMRTALNTTFATTAPDTVWGAVKRLFGILWWPFILLLGIFIFFVGVGVGPLIVGYGMFETEGVNVYHLGLATALFVMLLLVVRR